MYSSFYVALGAFMTVAAVTLVWLWRRSPDPVWVKVMSGALLTGLACYVPFAVTAILGKPVPVHPSDLAEEIRLISVYSASDDAAYLWVYEGDAPRAYVVSPLTPELKSALKEAMQSLQHGQTATIRHGKRGEKGEGKGAGESSEKKKKGNASGIGVVTNFEDDQDMFTLDTEVTRPTKTQE